jgi:TruD family tRNA pseudouridine synthase
MEHDDTHRETSLTASDVFQPPLHSLLLRHYSTIGIGDVFLKGPSHALPKSYLHNSVILPDAFTSWEIVGVIKSCPEDFVVREIGTKGRTIENLTADEVEKIRIATVSDGEQLTYPAVNSSGHGTVLGRPDKPPPSSMETTPRSFSNLSTTNDAVRGEPVSEQKKNNLSPEEEARRLLEEVLDVNPEENVRQVHETMTAISSLQVDASACIGRMAMLCNDPKSFELDKALETVGCHNLSLRLPPIKKLDPAKRGEIHRALRTAFVFLRSDYVGVSSSLPSESISLTVDTYFFGAIPYLLQPESDLLVLYSFFRKGCDHSTLDMSWRGNSGKKRKASNARINGSVLTRENSVTLRLRPGLQKEDRRNLHTFVSGQTNNRLGSDTIASVAQNDASTGLPETSMIAVHWTPNAIRKASKKRLRDTLSIVPIESHPHSLFVLKKSQKEHLVAIRMLVKAIGCRQSDIGLGGIKDMQAVTYQFCTVSSTPIQNIIRASQALKSSGISIGRVHKVNWTLNKGDLEGNRFEIVIRNARRVKVTQKGICVCEEFVNCELRHLQQMADRIREHGFLNFYGEQRVGIAGESGLVGTRAFDIGRAMLQGNFDQAVDLILRGRSLVRGMLSESSEVQRVRQVWKESSGDPDKAWKVLPRNDIMPRERLLLHGLKRYGKDKPLEALRCVHHNERMFWISAYQSYIWNCMATARINLYGSKPVEGDLYLKRCDVGQPLLFDGREKGVTLMDVVLPLPGSNVEYPSNEVGKLYRDILKKDEIAFNFKDEAEATAKGAYRYLVTSAANLSVQPLTSASELESLDFKLTFDLSKGSYATMLLRELMITTCSRES